MRKIFAALFAAAAFLQCSNNPGTSSTTKATTVKPAVSAAAIPVVNNVASPADILKRPQVPVLCYHHIRDWKPNEKSSMKVFLVPVAQFREQIKSLADSGYHTITPDEYYAYLTTGAPLPSKPVMITFDDTDEEQYTIGATELNKYGFKGVFFVMTISIGRPHYMSSEQIKDLSDHGHVIAAHTWDHHSMKDLHTDKDYSVQLTTSKQKLESIIGKHVDYFAYPFGVWDEKTIPQLKSRGYKAAFQLAQTKRDSLNPLYTIRRMLVPGSWNGAQMQKWMKVNFHS